jgi:RND family efflux transporter MFP subunit
MGVKRTGVAAAALTALAVLVSCQRRQPETAQADSPDPAVEARTILLAPQTFTATVPITGSLVSLSRVDVKAETTGRLVRFDKQEGEAVAAGEVVAWVEQENYRLGAQQAESAVQVAEAALARARVLESHACTELERARNLVSSGGITDKDLKAAAVLEQDAHAQVALALAQLAQARATLAVARKRLADCQVRAPVAGEIHRRFVNPGAYLEPPTMLFTLVDNRRLELDSPVPAADLGAVKPGQQATFSVSSYAGVSFAGRVLEINPAVDAETRAARVRIQADNRGGRLKAGMFAQGEILTGAARQAIVIPASAVYRDERAATESFVFVVQDGKAARRAVRIGLERNGMLEVTAGLKPGDLLIAGQSIEIAEGVRIRPQ